MFKKHSISFIHAFDGMIWALRTQPNYKIHLLLSLLSLIGAYIYKIDYYELLLIIFLITVGLVVETINTGLEQTTDAIDRKIREDIKIAKDVAAAAMLIYSMGAAAIALMIFLPKIFKF